MFKPIVNARLPQVLAVFLFALVLLHPPAASGEDRMEKISDLNGKRIAVIAGTSLDAVANAELDFTQIVYFDTSEQRVEALLADEVDAIIDDEPVVRYAASVDPRLRALEGILDEDQYGYAFRYGEDDLYYLVNRAMRQLIKDGTLAEMEQRWLDGKGERKVPEFPDPPENAPVLRFGVSSISAPFTYLDADGNVTGLDIEFMHRIANAINYRLEVTDMEFSFLIPSLINKRADVIGGCFSITPERAKLIRFTDPYHKGGVSALVLEDTAGTK